MLIPSIEPAQIDTDLIITAQKAITTHTLAEEERLIGGDNFFKIVFFIIFSKQ